MHKMIRVALGNHEKAFYDFVKNWIRLLSIDEGLPYQTLISSVLHKYINGHLVEKNQE